MIKDTKLFNKNPKKITYLASKEPHAQNPTYQIKGRVRYGCKYCKLDKQKGRYKQYSNLFCLYMHFTREHRNENYKELIMILADFVKGGVLI